MNSEFAIHYAVLDLPFKVWFSQKNRDILNSTLQSEFEWARPVTAVHHFYNIWVFAENVDETRMWEGCSYVCSYLTRVFLSRIRVRKLESIELAKKEIDAQIHNTSVSIYQRLPTMQNDLFEQASVNQMPDWFRKGTWITQPSMR
ncbi:MAG: hypothetical protein WC666_03360 [Candidatus Paceibacterota bacterium]